MWARQTEPEAGAEKMRLVELDVNVREANIVGGTWACVNTQVTLTTTRLLPQCSADAEPTTTRLVLLV
ncbi:hypothetical protein HPB52_014299 [Rhipicephalus sanguineus]|uniref:Uncharacterized protein n=1 Tax=Rhipicephalus sanguineus TaxID=34632 RepID=A0A9D4QEH2_RHISA|nr:hypothetical protein HPB52_014299 [Rhipicephalus sanguineus]